MNLLDAYCVCIDVETTGLNPKIDRIIEVGLVRWCHRSTSYLMSYLVNPGRPIPEAASRVNSITDEMVMNAPTLEEISADVLDYVRIADVLVAYNWPFDSSFMEAELGDRWRAAVGEKPIIDPLVVARQAAKMPCSEIYGLSSRRLVNVAEGLGIAVPTAHRSAADCELTCRVLERLLPMLPNDALEASALIDGWKQEQDKERRNAR